MKTRGLANLQEMSDDDLQRMIASACLDVYEATTIFRGEITLVDFSLETLHRFTSERDRRKAVDDTDVKIGMTTTKIGLLG